MALRTAGSKTAAQKGSDRFSAPPPPLLLLLTWPAVPPSRGERRGTDSLVRSKRSRRVSRAETEEWKHERAEQAGSGRREMCPPLKKIVPLLRFSSVGSPSCSSLGPRFPSWPCGYGAPPHPLFPPLATPTRRVGCHSSAATLSLLVASRA